MEIKTSYSPEDIAWGMMDNKVSKIRVLKVTTISVPNPNKKTTAMFETEVKYYTDAKSEPFNEWELFKSKEALIQSL